MISRPLKLRSIITYLSLAFFFALAPQVQAAKIAIIQADHSDFGRRFFSGFSSLANQPISAFQYKQRNEAALINWMKQNTPDIVVTLGEVPLPKLVSLLPSTPFIVGEFHSQTVSQKANVVQLESRLPIGAGLTLATMMIPSIKTVGTIYNPKQSSDTFAKLVEITGKMKLKLASLKVDRPQDVQALINAFSGKVDLLYWIRDSTTAHLTSLDEIYRFANQNNIPVVTTDPAQSGRGALLSIALDPFRLGDSAWKTASLILSEGKIPQMPVQVSANQLITWTSINRANRFGINAETFHRFVQKAIDSGYGVRIVP